ncbi:MAG: peptide chain release factor N(5)-glutamine methyltransferase [Deltaproteobacteria bacterium]|nr:peptide chain release factor N(5)-glutamine methyltransferase [Deltaproteobacteria bacterium]MBW2361806.1 peptide chain release factor N(5)-glutamine methyltransferase [Deltaproteobacteria bacterium]
MSAITPSSNTVTTLTTWTILDLLQWTQKYFAEKGIDTARLDAECLLAFVLGVDRMRLYIDYEKPVGEAERATLRELVRRRGTDRVPVAQIIGSKEFWSLDLRVTADVLTPRPDTETLVSAALGLLPDDRAPARILEIGTGSGAVALALASERPRAQVVASDVSAPALAVARENAERCGLLDRVELRQGALFEPVAGQRFDLVVSNPPYLAEAERPSLAPELAHEPDGALFAGPQGLEVLEPLVRQAPDALVPGGGLVVECDPRQADRVAGWCREAGLLSVTKHRDLAGRDRVVAARGGG